MRRVLRKLNSQTGASLSMALLIFLVCTVIGSAVLVAGTAASGRMSETAEYDQRYYAVNSAVSLLREMINDQTVVINKSGSTVTMDGADLPSTYSSFTKEAAYQLVCASTLPTGSRSFQLTDTAGSKPEIAVDISETINPDGSLVFLVSKTDPPKKTGNPSRTYSVRVTFALDKQVETKIEHEADGAGTETETTTLKWKLSGIETVTNTPIA